MDGHHGMMQGGLITVRRAAEFLSLSRSKLYLLMDEGRLPYVQVDRSRRIPRDVLQQFAAAHLVGDPESLTKQPPASLA